VPLLRSAFAADLTEFATPSLPVATTCGRDWWLSTVKGARCSSPRRWRRLTTYVTPTAIPT